ncbi:MAG: hypothetical protein IIU36_05030 [Firmicutes bacterium]|nr:hypothetical protein [Bacillota bacterium]
MAAPPAMMTIILWLILSMITMLASTPKKIAMPPNLGIAELCILLLSFGISIAPIFGAIFIARGVDAKDTTNAIENVRIKVL